MKTILLSLAAVTCFSHLGLPGLTRAQYFYNPSEHFEKIDFEQDVRGAYNISYCVKQHMKCWEIVKPDLMCRSDIRYTSICDILQEYCTDFYEDQVGYQWAMQTQEGWCTYREYHTK